MCVVEREIHVQPTGARQIIETERPCRSATATRLCNKVDHRLVQKSYTGIIMPSTERERHDDLIVTEGRDGIERVYREVTRQHRRRRSRTSRHSASSSGTPISSEESTSVSSPSRYSTVEVKPALLSPRIRSWNLPQRERSPDRKANEGQRSTTPGEKTISDPAPFLKSPRAATDERNNATPSWNEQNRRLSSPNRITPNKSPPPTGPHRPQPSLKPQTGLTIPSPITAPIISSPGLSSLPELRHRRNDSAKSFVSKESSRGNGSSSDRSTSRRSVAEGQHVRFENYVAVGRGGRDETSPAWSERSTDHGHRYGGRDVDTLDGSRTDVRVEEGLWERQKKAPVTVPRDRGHCGDEDEGSMQRRDRHRRRAEDALNGRTRSSTWEGDTDPEPRKMARERPTGGVFDPEERAGRDGLETSRSSSRTAERSPISSSSKSKDCASSPRRSKPARRVTVHQYRYGEIV